MTLDVVEAGSKYQPIMAGLRGTIISGSRVSQANNGVLCQMHISCVQVLHSNQFFFSQEVVWIGLLVL